MPNVEVLFHISATPLQRVGQGQLFVKRAWALLHLMRHAVHWGRTPCSQLQTHVPLSAWHPRTKSPPIPCICSRKQNKTKIIKKLLSVVTYHVYSPVPSQAMQCGGTAATSLCQLGSLSGGNAPGGTADVCTPAQMGTTLPAPLLAGIPA